MRILLWTAFLTAISVPAIAGKPRAISVGWHDEFASARQWSPIGAENPPEVITSHRGSVSLRLPHVPAGFPYSYQWNGLTTVATVDLGRYPVLIARVKAVAPGSYAHLDVEERDYSGHTVRTARSNTLTSPGITQVDLGREWGPDVRRAYLRLIVGGKLEGASCEYAWIRFVSREDGAFLTAHPDWQWVSYDPALPYQQ